MMKEFGIEFRTKHRNFDVIFFRDFSKMWVNDVNVDNDSGAIRLLDVINCRDESKNRVNDRIYVIEESESILEIEKGDLINYKSRSGKNKITATYLESFIDDDGQGKWKLQSQGMNSPKIYRIDQRSCEIIMRANKQFFMPEVEKELEQEKTMQLHASSGKFGQEKEIINN